jgi:hypothetical protein
MNEAIPILIQAGLTISKPETWTQGAIARRKSGVAISNPSASACTQRDIIGAVYAVLGLSPSKPENYSPAKYRKLMVTLCALSLTASRIHKKTIEGVNDSGDHGQALELIRATIRREREVERSLQN